MGNITRPDRNTTQTGRKTNNIRKKTPKTGLPIREMHTFVPINHFIYPRERYRLDEKNKAFLCQTNQEFEQISSLEELYRCCLSSSGNLTEVGWVTLLYMFVYMQAKAHDVLVISELISLSRIVRKLDAP